MKTFIRIVSLNVTLLLLSSFLTCSMIQRGPNGGAVVWLKNSKAMAEILANADSGAVLIYTWDAKMKKRLPVNYKPLMVSSGNVTVDLQPYPTADDSAGYSSRFYGKADWLREEQMRFGWLGGGMEQIRYEFYWKTCLKAGKSHRTLFEEMDKNEGGMKGDGTGDMIKNRQEL